jgi:phospholipid/cholesterol/gamma-HCH transport system permease protein
MPAPASVQALGGFFALCGDTVRALGRRPFALGEFLEQTAFLASVSVLPAIATAIPFVVVTQFFIGLLLSEIGAADASGAGAGLAVIKEIGPFVAVLVIAGAGATAVCSDLGARKIREEIDAMVTLGIDPIQRLVVPRICAFVVVSIGLFGLVSLVGLVGCYVFTVLAQGGSPGLFVTDLTLITHGGDVLASLIKSAIFGLAAGLVACYLGLNAKGGPKGVGEAVNQTVVFVLMVLLVINTTISAVVFQIS